MTIRLAVVHAGLSHPSTTSRLADSLQQAFVDAVEANSTSTSVTRIDVRDVAVKVAEATVSGVQSEQLEEALTRVARADVLIAMTPTFNASYSGLFKSFFDLIEPGALEGTVVALGATGGTARHSLVVDTVMRPLFTYMRALPVPTSIFASADDFAGSDSIARRARVMAREALTLLGHSSPSVARSNDGASTLEESEGSAHSAALRQRAHSATRAEVGLGADLDREVDVIEAEAGNFIPLSDIAHELGLKLQ